MSVMPGYEFGERLYQGARSVVYRARRDADGAAVVIKQLAREFPSPAELGHFRREYDILSSLQIPGVVRALALDHHRGRLALVMEDFGAESLASYLRLRQRLDVREALTIALAVVVPLGEIHRRHVIHRDLNPMNLVIKPIAEGAAGWPGEVKIIDFGLATLLSRASPLITNPNVIEGTLRYISPEQTGRVNRAVDYRTDFYSLGVTLYELLVGEPPFQSGDAVEIVHRHIAAEPVPPSALRSDVPREVSAVIGKLLAKTAEARYQSAAGIAADLEECVRRLDAVDALHAGAELPAFVPGRQDVADRFQEPQRLYGRDEKIAALLSAFDRVAEGFAEVVLVAGYAGVGKSSVVHEVHRPILARRGFFISGKFDQLQRDIPYASLIQAFQDLVRQILTEKEDVLAGWRRTIAEALGANGGVIVAVIPDVALVIGPQPPVVALPPVEAQNRFNFVLQSFVRAFAAADHPLVVFLDDLQWADTASLDLIHVLATDPGSRHLLILGAYRDNEVSDAHPLALAVEAMAKAGARLSTLELQPLGESDVTALVAECLRESPEQVVPLASLCFEKTRGNPFFLNQFLRSLFDDGLIAFEPARRAFAWNVDEIRRRGITDNVVELMVGKIQRLPADTQRALELSACIGNRFDTGTLSVVGERSRKDTGKSLWTALVEGFVLPAQEGHELAEPSGEEWAQGEEIPVVSYRFLHDRVQQAAYSLIPEEARGGVHLTIARLLHRSAGEGGQAPHLFDVVNHYNLGASGVTAAEERREIARLNLRAGQKAKLAAAYEPARRYLEAGLRLLSEGSWDDHYDLAFAMHAEAIEAAYLTTHLERARELAEVAMAHAATVLDKVRILETRMLFHTAKNQINETVATAHEALALLGFPLPPIDSVDLPRMLGAMEATVGRLAGRRAPDLQSLPEVTEPHVVAALRIMVTAGPPTYIVSPISFPVLACAMVDLCLEHGNCTYSGYTYSAYGLLLTDVVAKNEYGDLAAWIVERYAGRDKAKVLTLLAIFIRHWKVHVREGLGSLLEAVRAALDVGDLEFVGYASMHYVKDIFYAGEPLAVVDREARRYVALMRQLKQEFPRLYLAVTQQAAQCLMGHDGGDPAATAAGAPGPAAAAADPLRLTGEAFDEDRDVPVLIGAKNIPSLHLYWIDKALIAYVFCAYREALAAAEKAAEYTGGHLGMSPVVLENFLRSLSLLALAGDLGEEEKAEALARVAKSQVELEKWATDGPANYRHKYLLVEAERARLTGRGPEAMDLYEQAIRGAAEARCLHEEAIACERCAELHLAAGRERLGQSYLAEARHAYERWGALAKVAELDRRYPSLRAPRDAQESSLSISESGSSSGAVLDLATVMKAARAISGEIMLSRLVSAVLHHVVENAGAQRGVLLLEHDGRLVVEASHATGGDEPGAALVSEAIVNYVARTGENVILADASQAERFAADPYVRARRPRSVLAAPLVNQGKGVGVVYLENNLAPGAFTAARLEVIRLLLAQAALSIQNARLYESLEASNRKLEEYNESLERKVAERTHELVEKNDELGHALSDLRATQAQLVTQEKLASLGALTAGIAHEIKNPMNFVTNFASLSAGFVDEIAAGVEAHVTDPAAREDLGAVLSDLRENVTRIEGHGRRANSIIDGMLLHARQGSAVREEADLNALVTQAADLAFHALRAKDGTLDLEVARDFDPDVGRIDMVPSEMSRVFVNLLNNAWYAVVERQRAAGAGYRPRIAVTTRSLGDLVEVRVRDNGTGMTPDIVPRIYHPFFTTKPTGAGTGLGLSISYDILTKGHQGRIRVETAPDEGAEFVITLPRRFNAEARPIRASDTFGA